MAIFFCAKNGWVGDVIPYYDDGEFKLFFLKAWLDDYNGADKVLGWQMATTRDHLHFTEQSCHIVGGTGSVIKVDGIYHMFFCRKKYLRHAISMDLSTWTELEEDTFTADGIIYEKSDWRDPFVFWNDSEKQYWMLMAAKKKGNTTRKGCVGLCVSKDLHKWKYREPIYAPAIHQCAHECPDLFKIGDWYYLLFSAYTDRFATYYRMSKSIDGPWITPEVDTFDTRAYYAAKTGFDGRDRYLYGWNPTRTNNMWGFNPEHYEGCDYNTWDWWGNMVVHKLIQNSDGTLSVTVPESVDKAFSIKQKMEITPLTGDWVYTSQNASAESHYQYSAALLPRVPPLSKIEMDVCYDKPPRQFGIALQVDEEFSRGYYLCFEPYRNRVVYKTGIRMYEDGGKMFSYDVEMERPIMLAPHTDYKVRAFVQDTLLEVYVADQMALSARMYDYTGRKFGLFVTEGSASFKNIKLFTTESMTIEEAHMKYKKCGGEVASVVAHGG